MVNEILRIECGGVGEEKEMLSHLARFKAPADLVHPETALVSMKPLVRAQLLADDGNNYKS